jgi:hypothetical protein
MVDHSLRAAAALELAGTPDGLVSGVVPIDGPTVTLGDGHDIVGG